MTRPLFEPENIEVLALAGAHQVLRDPRVPLGIKLMMSDANPLLDAFEMVILRDRERYILHIAELESRLTP